jgi:hypothetical protein
MSEAAPADGGQGAAASSSSAVLTSGAAPAAPATTQPTSAQVTPAPTAAAAPNAAWLGEGVDELTLGYVQNKGWDNPLKAIQSYQNLEKLLGADKAGNAVVIPKADADPKDWAQVYDKLGRPGDPKGYKVNTPEGGNKEFQDQVLTKIHELGLTKNQGEALVNWYNETAQGQIAAQQQAKAAQFQQDDSAIHQEWGAAYTQNLAQAQSAARALGLDAATIDKISDALGHKGTLQLLQKIGSKAAESDFVSGDSNNRFGNIMSPPQAKSEIKSLMGDKDFVSKYLAKNAEAVARMTQLQQWAYPE